MVIDPRNNYLVTGPSISPENSFRHQGQEFCASMMPTCDRVLAYEIFSACLQSTEILNVDASFADSLPYRYPANSSLTVSAQTEEYRNGLKITKRQIPNHRHTTFIILYPYSPNYIGQDTRKGSQQAAAKTIEKRLAA